jgi:hypothetical protein
MTIYLVISIIIILGNYNIITYIKICQEGSNIMELVIFPKAAAFRFTNLPKAGESRYSLPEINQSSIIKQLNIIFHNRNDLTLTVKLKLV